MPRRAESSRGSLAGGGGTMAMTGERRAGPSAATAGATTTGSEAGGALLFGADEAGSDGVLDRRRADGVGGRVPEGACFGCAATPLGFAGVNVGNERLAPALEADTVGAGCVRLGAAAGSLGEGRASGFESSFTAADSGIAGARAGAGSRGTGASSKPSSSSTTDRRGGRGARAWTTLAVSSSSSTESATLEDGESDARCGRDRMSGETISSPGRVSAPRVRGRPRSPARRETGRTPGRVTESLAGVASGTGARSSPTRRSSASSSPWAASCPARGGFRSAPSLAAAGERCGERTGLRVRRRVRSSSRARMSRSSRSLPAATSSVRESMRCRTVARCSSCSRSCAVLAISSSIARWFVGFPRPARLAGELPATEVVPESVERFESWRPAHVRAVRAVRPTQGRRARGGARKGVVASGDALVFGECGPPRRPATTVRRASVITVSRGCPHSLPGDVRRGRGGWAGVRRPDRASAKHVPAISLPRRSARREPPTGAALRCRGGRAACVGERAVMDRVADSRVCSVSVFGVGGQGAKGRERNAPLRLALRSSDPSPGSFSRTSSHSLASSPSPGSAPRTGGPTVPSLRFASEERRAHARVSRPVWAGRDVLAGPTYTSVESGLT